MDSKDLSGVKHVRLDMTARAKGKGAPDKGHTTSFSPSKVVHYFPNFRSYFGMEYEQPWNMGKILLESYLASADGFRKSHELETVHSLPCLQASHERHQELPSGKLR